MISGNEIMFLRRMAGFKSQSAVTITALVHENYFLRAKRPVRFVY